MLDYFLFSSLSVVFVDTFFHHLNKGKSQKLRQLNCSHCGCAENIFSFNRSLYSIPKKNPAKNKYSLAQPHHHTKYRSFKCSSDERKRNSRAKISGFPIFLYLCVDYFRYRISKKKKISEVENIIRHS
jgi:hypothetical protein